MIDLHMHSTASDGRLTPEALVARAAGAGLTIISVTDHDTTAGLPEAAAAARRHGIRLVNGIEITAVENGRDIHVIGYFFDPAEPALADFLRGQREDRLRRLTSMAARLRDLGFAIDVAPLIEEYSSSAGRTVGRPQLADALIAAGLATDRRDAFDRLLGEGRPAFVPRSGASVANVAAIIARAGGVASLAHPGLMHLDDAIPAFAASGLPAIEVWHSDHDEAATARYKRCAAELGLGASGGSDYHAEHSHHTAVLGSVTLPPDAFADLESRARSGRNT